mmetsp:Transcript_28677/g.66519  ORF Transcript_28677/g.66519 Transcript_28677/m.66519 type:complete len:219 (+) Transcript_28677:1154-1810(+)
MAIAKVLHRRLPLPLPLQPLQWQLVEVAQLLKLGSWLQCEQRRSGCRKCWRIFWRRKQKPATFHWTLLQVVFKLWWTNPLWSSPPRVAACAGRNSNGQSHHHLPRRSLYQKSWISCLETQQMHPCKRAKACGMRTFVAVRYTPPPYSAPPEPMLRTRSWKRTCGSCGKWLMRSEERPRGLSRACSGMLPPHPGAVDCSVLIVSQAELLMHHHWRSWRG